MTGSIINDLFNGSIDPLESINPADPEYRTLGKQIREEKSGLKEKLGEKEVERLEELEGMYNNHAIMYAQASFAYGLKLGVLFMFEIFGRENNPED